MSDRVEHVDIIGRKVDRAYKTHDGAGYDLLHIHFDDGSALMVIEEGQAGYFKVNVVPPMLKAREEDK